MLHIALHFLVPAVVAGIFYREQWVKVFLILIATMVVDLDHLLADPIYDPDRCSIGFHPLHSWIAIGVYVVMLFFKKTKIVGLGLVIHMILDFIDCYT
jgi:hypothetical protein